MYINVNTKLFKGITLAFKDDAFSYLEIEVYYDDECICTLNYSCREEKITSLTIDNPEASDLEHLHPVLSQKEEVEKWVQNAL